MVFRKVECVEVVPLGLRLRAFSNLVAERNEDVDHLVDDGRHRVHGALWSDVDGEGHVDALIGEGLLELSCCEHFLTSRDGLVDLTASLADTLADLLASSWRQRADLAVRERQRRAIAVVCEASLLQLLRRACTLDRYQRVGDVAVDDLWAECCDLLRVEVVIGPAHGTSPDLCAARRRSRTGRPRQRSKG